MLNGVFNGIGGIISTLDGSAADLAATYKSLLDVRQALAGAGITGDVVTRDLIRGAGSRVPAKSGTQAYFDNYFSDAEKLAIKTQQMSVQFKALGAAMPDDKDGFRALVKGIDTYGGRPAPARTSAKPGRRLLSEVSTSAKEAATAAARAAKDAADAAAEAASKAQDAAMAALERAIGAQRDAITKQQQITQGVVGNLQSIFNLLGTNVAELYNTVTSAAITGAKQGQAFITNALANARATGYLPDQKDLTDAITAARGGLSDDRFKTKDDQDFAKLVLAGQLRGLQDIAGKQLTDAQRMLQAEQAQLDQLNALLTYEKNQLDALRGIDTSILSVAEAVRRLEATMHAGKPPAAATGSPSGASFGAGGASVAADYGWQSLSNGFKYSLNGDTSAIQSAGGSLLFSDFRQFVSANLDPKFLYQRLHVELGLSEQDIAAALHQPDTSIVNDFFSKAGIPAFATGGDFAGERAWSVKAGRNWS